jgi:hypothetical protein
MLTSMLAAAALLWQATAAAAPAPEPAKPDAAPHTLSGVTATGKSKAANDPEALVCHSEPVLGSRMAVKRCMTKADADMQKFEQRQELERMQGSTYQH